MSTRQARLVSRSRAPIWLLPSSGSTASPNATSTESGRRSHCTRLSASLDRRGLLTSLTHKGVFIDAGRITDGVADRLRQEVLDRLSEARRRPLHRGRHRGPCDPFRSGRASRFARVRTPSPTPRSRARPSGAPGIDLKGGNRRGRRNSRRAISNGWTSSTSRAGTKRTGRASSPVTTLMTFSWMCTGRLRRMAFVSTSRQ